MESHNMTSIAVECDIDNSDHVSSPQKRWLSIYVNPSVIIGLKRSLFVLYLCLLLAACIFQCTSTHYKASRNSTTFPCRMYQKYIYTNVNVNDSTVFNMLVDFCNETQFDNLSLSEFTERWIEFHDINMKKV